MTCYYFDTVLTFGKYEGKNVREILELDAPYIEWCCINLDHFLISADVIEALDTVISDENKKLFLQKLEEFEAESITDNDYYDRYYDLYGHETYDDYSGSYAQDAEDLSDQFIDDVLCGDPDAYWNID